MEVNSDNLVRDSSAADSYDIARVNIKMNAQEVIEFDNLRQRAAMLGEKEYTHVLRAKVAPFVSENALGVIRKVNGYQEVADIAAASGKNILTLLRSEEE